MKFGKDFHLYQVPAWTSHYLPYRQLKALIKSASRLATQCPTTQTDFTDLYVSLDRDIANVDGFCHGRYELLTRKQKHICEQNGGSDLVTPFRQPDLLHCCELEGVRATFTELQKNYVDLQWFCRVNHEATLRIYTKLETIDPAFGQMRQAQKIAWLNKQRYHEDRCLDQIEALQTYISNLSQARRSTNPSLYFQPLYEQLPEAARYLTDIDRYARTCQTPALVKVLEEVNFVLKPSPKKFHMISYHLLTLLISSRAWACAKALVINELILQYSHVDHNLLSHLITVSSRSYPHNCCAINGSDHPGSQDLSLEHGEGSSLFLELLKRLGPQSKDILQTRDSIGCLPLHYGAKYGLTAICKSILGSLQDQHQDMSSVRTTILATDDEGFTPLHWSVIYSNIEITRLFLTALDTNFETTARTQDPHLIAILSDLFFIALKDQDDDMVRLLASSHISVSHQSGNGETSLYIAARIGREDYVTMLLSLASDQNSSIDIPENAYGWTPLFIACVEGHLHIVDLLLQHGADATLVDYLGWTAKEHATFRGHLPTAETLPISRDAEATGGPAQTTSHAIETPRYHLQLGSAYVVVNLGVMQNGRQTKPVDLKCSMQGINPALYNNTLSLEISMPTSGNTSYMLRLPLLDDPVDNTFVFPIKNPSEARIIFKLFRNKSTCGNDGSLIGTGTAILQDDRNCFGAHRESLIREHCIPILEKETMDLLGTLTFTFVLAKPFPHTNCPTQNIGLLERSNQVYLIGHRGLGQNLGESKYLQLGENTVESFLAAAKLGASHVEFDVQMTRDLVPVLYHDYSLSESGTDVPIHDLTLNQFTYISKIQSARSYPISILGNMGMQSELLGSTNSYLRSRSFGSEEKGPMEVLDRMKHTVDFINKGFKPNTRGKFIHDTFATLEEALRDVPESIGFDMEIKYPRIHEALGADIAPVTIDLNIFIDTILATVLRFAGGRSIILSSFTPEVCILLAMKQKFYPVLFITNAGKRPISDKEKRAESLQVAVRFARQWGLAGIVFASDALVMCPRLVGYVERKGLKCGSYGTLNNVPEKVELQVKAGVSLIVADRVGLISKTLKG